MSEVVTLRLKDIADALGVKPPQATRYAQRGMPTHDIEAARQWKRDNIRERITPPARPPEGATAAGPPQMADADPNDYWTSRARREAAEARMAELKLAEQAGELVRTADVRAAMDKRLVGLREAILQIPSRLAAIVAAESDQQRCHRLIEQEMHALLQLAAS